jgi:hypothetical protein
MILLLFDTLLLDFNYNTSALRFKGVVTWKPCHFFVFLNENRYANIVLIYFY